MGVCRNPSYSRRSRAFDVSLFSMNGKKERVPPPRGGCIRLYPQANFMSSVVPKRGSLGFRRQHNPPPRLHLRSSKASLHFWHTDTMQETADTTTRIVALVFPLHAATYIYNIISTITHKLSFWCDFHASFIHRLARMGKTMYLCSAIAERILFPVLFRRKQNRHLWCMM